MHHLLKNNQPVLQLCPCIEMIYVKSLILETHTRNNDFWMTQIFEMGINLKPSAVITVTEVATQVPTIMETNHCLFFLLSYLLQPIW